jgi:hypothetical protein
MCHACRAQTLAGRLTETLFPRSQEQKRTNHILSEQKRRNAIRTGFVIIASLFPASLV